MQNLKNLKSFLPEFPRTPHVPFKPNMGKDDILASSEEIKVLFQRNIDISEKLDGANCGMALVDDQPVIRNHNHILNKAYSKNTPAKKQFASVFNWFYENKNKFEILNEAGPFSVFGEWMVAQHGIKYDALPAWFIAFDLYNYESGEFVETITARKVLQDSGFELVPQLFYGQITTFEEISQMTKKTSDFTNSPIEGVYIKISNGDWITNRFKMVREDFVQGALWDSKSLKKNVLR